MEYLTELVKQLEVKNMIMVSPSMSGNFGLPFVLTYPELIAGFVPIAPAATGIVPPSKVRSFKVRTPKHFLYYFNEQASQVFQLS